MESDHRVTQVPIHYNWLIPWEYKSQEGLQFSQYNPRLKYFVKVTSIESVELQERGSSDGHYLPHGGEGLSVTIKDVSSAGDDTSKIGESK